MRVFILTIIGIASLTCFAVSPASAQSIFGFGAKKNDAPQQAKIVSPPVNQVLTPDQFSNKVNDLGQETKSPVRKQITEILNTKQPGPPTPATDTKPAGTQTTTQTTNAAGAGSPASPIAQPNVAPAPTSPAAPGGGTTLPGAQAPANKPSAPQPQPYTGFGVPANNSGGTNNAPAGQSGGWNIKY